MPKYAWYFINKMMTSVVARNIPAYSNHLTFKLILISYLTYTKCCIHKPCYCTRWFAFSGYPAGVLPYMANMGMCLSGQTIARVQDLDTLATNEPLLKSI